MAILQKFPPSVHTTIKVICNIPFCSCNTLSEQAVTHLGCTNKILQVMNTQELTQTHYSPKVTLKLAHRSAKTHTASSRASKTKIQHKTHLILIGTINSLFQE